MARKNAESVCCVCGKKEFINKMNGIYTKLSLNYYCHKKECQGIFTENAGNIPEDW